MGDYNLLGNLLCGESGFQLLLPTNIPFVSGTTVERAKVKDSASGELFSFNTKYTDGLLRSIIVQQYNMPGTGIKRVVPFEIQEVSLGSLLGVSFHVTLKPHLESQQSIIFTHTMWEQNGTILELITAGLTSNEIATLAQSFKPA